MPAIHEDKPQQLQRVLSRKLRIAKIGDLGEGYFEPSADRAFLGLLRNMKTHLLSQGAIRKKADFSMPEFLGDPMENSA
ncbi:MAG: hypothetical protein WCY67_11500 [Acidithiobacillus sp.]